MKRFLFLVVCLCFFATVVEAAQTFEVPSSFQRGMSQKILYDLLVEAQTDLTDIYTDYRAGFTHFKDGKSASGGDYIIESSEHVKMELQNAFVQLIEAPDSSTKTLTIQLLDGIGGELTDTITFTQGTETTGDVKAFTLKSHKILCETFGLKVNIAGTTTTAGEVVIHTEWKGLPD